MFIFLCLALSYMVHLNPHINFLTWLLTFVPTIIIIIDVIISVAFITKNIKKTYLNKFYHNQLFNLFRSTCITPKSIYESTNMNYFSCIIWCICLYIFTDLYFIGILIVDTLHFVTHVGRIKW